MRIFCRSAIGASLILLALGCNSKSLDNFKVIEKDAYAAYCSQSLEEAENGLRKLSNALTDYRASGVKGIYYDKAFGFVYARLSLVLSKKGDVAGADKYLTYSLESFQRDLNLNGGGTATCANVLKLINKIDAGMNVQWRSLP